MKICFFATTVLEHGGGLESFFIETSKELNKNYSQNIEIVTMDENFSLKIVNLLSIYNLRRYNKSILNKITREEMIEKLGSVKYIKCRSIKELRATLSQFDVVYSKNELLDAFILKLLVGYKNLPKVIFGCHTSPNYTRLNGFKDHLRNILYSGFVYKFLSSGVSAFHVLNKSDEKFIQQRFPSTAVYRIPNSFDFAKFSNESTKYSYNLGELNHFRILWLGVIHSIKGIDDLVQVIRSINSNPNQMTKISWIIVGDGQESYKIKELSKEYSNVKFTGYVSHEFIANIISQSTFVISTSRIETFSYSTIEANAMDKLVISYPTAGQSDLITNTQNGYLVDDIASFVKCIEELITNEIPNEKPSVYIKNKVNNNQIYNGYIEMFKIVSSRT